MYSYCNSNPIISFDPTGKFFWLIPLFLGATAFAVGNTVVQLGTDLVHLALTGKWDSGFEEYLGAFLGGLIGGFTFVASGFNIAASFAAIGFSEAFSTNIFTNLTGKTHFSLEENLFTSVLMAVAGFGSGRIFGGTKIKAITTGRNSYLAVFKSSITKVIRGSINKTSSKTFLKGVLSLPVLKFASIILINLIEILNKESK